MTGHQFEPKWIAWEMVRRCNLRCVHCRSASDETAVGEVFDARQCKDLLSEIAADYSPVVVLSGGEPLLRRDLFEIAAHGTSLGLRMCIATNGTLVDDTVCEQMKAAEIKMVSLSLDGSSAAIHDDFRQQLGAFDGTLRAAEHFRRHEIPFLINSSFTKRNQHDIAATFRLAKELGARAWYMFMIVPTGRGEDVMEELISAADYDEILDWHYDAERREDEILMRPTCAPHYYRVVLQRQKADEEKWRRRSLTFSTGGGKGCIAAQSICLIDVQGNVLPCSYFPLSAGNVRDKPFAEIWKESSLFADLRDLSRYRGRCGACEYLNVCGGCRARAYAVTGDYLAEEPFCDHVPIKMRKSNNRRAVVVVVVGIALLLVASVGYMIYTTVESGAAVEYFEEVDHALADLRRGKSVGRRIRLHGNVVAGTIQQRSGSLDYRFAVFHGAEWTDVIYHGIVPDTLKDCAEVVVSGRFTSPEGRRFAAERVTGKCPSKYDEREHVSGCGAALRGAVLAARARAKR